MQHPPHLTEQARWLVGLVRRAAAHLPDRSRGRRTEDHRAEDHRAEDPQTEVRRTRDLTFRHKDTFDVVTSADTAVEDFLCDELRKRFGEDRILAEESVGSRPADLTGRCWVIDPLDGTVNFLHTLPFWAISVALLVDGIPQLGVVLEPLRDELFYAERGGGAYLNGQRLRCPEDAMRRSLGASSGCLERWSKEPRILSDIMARYGKVRILGSQALHLCYLAAGRLGAAMSVEARLWDDAAAALVVMESGFQYTDFMGAPRFPVASDSPWLRGEAGDSLAAGAALHGELVSLFHQVTTP